MNSDICINYDESSKWQNILDNLIGKAKSPQFGWSGDLNDCDN
jgi:hypothetical protein